MRAPKSMLRGIVEVLTFHNMPIRRKFLLFSVGVSLWFLVLGGLAAFHVDDMVELGVTLGVLVVAHALLLLFTFTISSSLKEPLDAIVGQIRAITQGDLSAFDRIAVRSGDEVGELSARFNRLLDTLRELNVFKRVIEEDSDTGDVYERLSDVFERHGLPDHAIWELAPGGGLRSARPGESPPWCAAGIREDAGLCRAMKTGQDVFSRDFPAICKQFVAPGLEHTCVPLLIGGSPAGVVQFVHGGAGEPEDAQATRLRVERSLRFVREALPVLEAKQLAETLREGSLRDPLTGLHNRRYLQEIQGRLVASAQRRGAALGLLMCDLDRFKALNDQHGHAAGDAVLRASTLAMASVLREADVLVRWGGEEFLALLVDADAGALLDAADRVRAAVEAVVVPHGGEELRCTVSIGAASFSEDAPSLEEAIRCADQALYEAKASGRNRVCRYGGTEASSPRAAATAGAPPLTLASSSR